MNIIKGHETLLRAQEQQRGLWNIIEKPRRTMKHHVGPWRAVEHHGGPLRAKKYHRMQCNAMVGHGTLLRAIEGHGIAFTLF